LVRNDTRGLGISELRLTSARSVQNEAITGCRVRPSVRMFHFRNYSTHFDEILYRRVSTKGCMKNLILILVHIGPT